MKINSGRRKTVFFFLFFLLSLIDGAHAVCTPTFTASSYFFDPFVGVSYTISPGCIAKELHVHAELSSNYWNNKPPLYGWEYIELPSELTGTFVLDNDEANHLYSETLFTTLYVDGKTAQDEAVEAMLDITPQAYILLDVQSNVTGIDFTVNNQWGPLQPVPIYEPFLAGAKITLSAPPTQTIDGRTYEFVRWADDIAATATREVTLPNFSTNEYGATFNNVAYSIEYVEVTPPSAPSISVQPANQSVTAGQTATFSITATGFPLPTYQWKKNGTDIPAATSASYTTPVTTLSDNGALYTCLVTNSQAPAGIASTAATLTVTQTTTCRPTLTADSLFFQPFEGVNYQISAGCIASELNVSATLTSRYWVDPDLNPSGIKYIDLPAALTGTFSLDNDAPDHEYAETETTTLYVTGKTAEGASVQESLVITPEGRVQVYFQSNFPDIDAELNFVINNKWGPSKDVSFDTPFLGGAKITMTAPENQTINGRTYQFRRWTDGGLATKEVTLPEFPFTNSTPYSEMNVYLVEYIDITDPIAPIITVDPINQSVNEGQTATFSISAIGNPTPTYQWKKNDVDIPGATSASYTTPITTLADLGTIFTCVVTNSQGSATSNTATLTVSAPLTVPGISVQPKNQAASIGQTATFSVTAAGNPTPTYQWKKNGAAIIGATSASYTTPAATLSDHGTSFTCVVTNSQGSTTSTAAILTLSADKTTFLPFQNIVDPTITPMVIRYSVNDGLSVELTVYDVQGHQVRSLTAENGLATWDGRNDDGQMVSADVYLLVLKSNGQAQTKKVALSK